MKQDPLLTFTIEAHEPASMRARITVDQQYVGSMYQEALLHHKREVRIQGFSQGTTPLAYLEKTYKMPGIYRKGALVRVLLNTAH